jgi:Tol biopolymer transport system component
MTPLRWREVERLFNDALERPADQRAAFLATACAGDDQLRAEVEALLAQKSSSALDRPAWEVFPTRSQDDTASIGLAAGSQLGPYRIEAPLGAGGMGEVFRAVDTRLGRAVAVKVSKEKFDERFAREARTISSLNHPHICTLYDVGPDYLVMELVEGETLSARLKRGCMPLADTLRYGAQIADALAEAHAKGIVHRDLKPGNIMIAKTGVKVLDFGLSKSRDDETLTAAHAIVGTPAYMPPEQRQGLICDARSDIYSLGLVLCEMASGKRSERGEAPGLPLLPPQLARIVERCLSSAPDDRWHSAKDVRIVLEWAGKPATPAEGAPPRRAKSWIPWTAAALAAAVAVAVWLARPTNAGLRDVPIERVTFDPGRAVTPAISRDGKLLAYASDRGGQGNLDLWVRQTAGGDPLRLTDDPGDDQLPDFSPDGSQIAFQSSRAGGGVYLIPALGGTPRLIAPSGRRPRFSPDGSRMTYWAGNFRGSASRPECSTFIVSLAGGNPVSVVPDFMVARDGVWSPDGRSLLLVGRSKSAGPLSQTFDWWWVPLDGRPPVRTGVFDLRDFRAAADIERLSLGAWTEAGVLFSEDGKIWLQQLSQDSGRRIGEPRLLASGAGIYFDPSISRDGQIVFDMSEKQRVIDRLPLSAAAPAIRLYADGQPRDYRASQTRDGRTIVLERAMGNRREIWRKDTQTGEQQMVLSVRSDSQVNATVSQDGSRIAYTVADISDSAKNPTAFGGGFVIETSGGIPKTVCRQCGLYAFLSDNRRILGTEGDVRIRTFDALSGSSQDVVVSSRGRLDRPTLSPNEHWVAFRFFENGAGKTFLAPFSTSQPFPAGSAQQVQEPTTTGRPCGWSPDSTILYLLLDTDGTRDLWGQRVDPASGHLMGVPYVVRHLHGSSIEGVSTSLGNAITEGGFLYEANTTMSSLWKFSLSAPVLQ